MPAAKGSARTKLGPKEDDRQTDSCMEVNGGLVVHECAYTGVRL
jgi:hypothetical protein